MRIGPVILIAMLSPGLAAARPLITIGATLGAAQSEGEAANDQGPDETYGVFARLNLSAYIAVQLELSRIDSDPSYDVRTATLLGVLDLGSGGVSHALRGRFVPILLAGVGEAWGSSAATSSDSYGIDALVGLGVEYRAVNGLTVGVQGRIGNRWITQAGAGGAVTCGLPCETPVNGVEYEGLWNGQFRSVLVTGGIAF